MNRHRQAVHRRRLRRRVYRRRRAAVALVALVVVAGIVAVSKSLDQDGSTAADPSQTTVSLPAAADVGTSTTGVALVVAPRMPTAADPARVLLVGDSEAGGLSPFLKPVMDATGLVTLTTDYQVSSGLVRPDFYDWPTHLNESVRVADPDIVVTLFGGNDGQPFPGMPSKPVDSPEWRAEYGKRVSAVMDFLSSDGRTLIWVGVPNAENDSLTASLSVQNDVVKEQVAAHPNVTFVDAWYRFTGIDGNFAPMVEDPRDGNYVAVRSETDGFHLNTVGEQILAFDVGNAVVAALRARGAAI